MDLTFDVGMRRRLEDLGASSPSDMVSSTTSALVVGACISMVSDYSPSDSSAWRVDIRAGCETNSELELFLFWAGEAEAGGVIGEL